MQLAYQARKVETKEVEINPEQFTLVLNREEAIHLMAVIGGVGGDTNREIPSLSGKTVRDSCEKHEVSSHVRKTTDHLYNLLVQRLGVDKRGPIGLIAQGRPSRRQVCRRLLTDPK